MSNENIKKTLQQLADGSETPFYCYFADTILNQIRLLKKTFPDNFQIFYSLKANSNPHVVNFIEKQQIYFDVASIDEMQIALNSGINPAKISYTGPGKDKKEIELILNNGIGFINIESISELDFILSRDFSRTKLLLRVAWPKSSTQFGIDLNEIKEILKIEKYRKHISGLHTHWKSQLLNSEKLLEHFKESTELALDLKNNHGLMLWYLNFGSGLGIPYFKEDRPLDLEQFRTLLSNYFEGPLLKKELKDVKVFVESGRFVVGESGFYVTKVVTKKRLRNKLVAIVDGGIHHFMAATGMGQILKRPFPIETLNTSPKEVVTIAGKTCSDQDIFATDLELPAINSGDVVCIGNAGAYGIGYSPVHFINHRVPEEFFIET